jgi:hypothetical protein
MHLSVSTLLDASPERVWEAVTTPALLAHVAAPLLRFDPVEPPALPDRWDTESYLVRLRLFGVVPLGTQTIRVSTPRVEETPGAQFYQLRDAGTGQLASTWDHLISLRETPDRKTVYTDEVSVEAGAFTPVLWLFAALFYRYRQYRWRRLVAEEFRALGGVDHPASEVGEAGETS